MTCLYLFAGIINDKPTRGRMVEVLLLLAWSWQPGSSWVGAKYKKIVNKKKLKRQHYYHHHYSTWSQDEAGHLYFALFPSFFSLEGAWQRSHGLSSLNWTNCTNSPCWKREEKKNRRRKRKEATKGCFHTDKLGGEPKTQSKSIPAAWKSSPLSLQHHLYAYFLLFYYFKMFCILFFSFLFF